MHTALVVDDSRAIRMIIGRILRELGFDVMEAGDGRQALERLGGRQADLVLCDWNMPEMNGLEMVQHLRAMPAYGATPFIMVTTEAEVEQMATAVAAGATEYVMKPFTRDILVDKLRLAGVNV